MASGVETFLVQAAKPSVDAANEQVFPASDAGGTFNFYSRSGDMKYVGLSTASATGEAGVGGTSVVLTNFFSNFDNTTQDVIEETSQKLNQVLAMENNTLEGTHTWASACEKITLEEGQVYEISFNVDPPTGVGYFCSALVSVLIPRAESTLWSAVCLNSLAASARSSTRLWL